MNVLRLKELRDFLKDKVSTRFNYRSWGTPAELFHIAEHMSDERREGYIGNDCGTGACAAGYTVALFDTESVKRKNVCGSYIGDRARDLLDLDESQSQFLFMPWRYTTVLSEFFNWTVSDINYPEDSATHKVLNQFVREADDEVQWQRHLDLLQRMEAVARIDFLVSAADRGLSPDDYMCRGWLNCLTPVEEWVVLEAKRMGLGPVERTIK